jgi:hypothetical protein
MSATLGMLILWFVIFQKFPSEWELICGIMVLFLVMSLLDGFYRFHLYRLVQNNINDSTERLRKRLSSSLERESYSSPVPYHTVDYDSGKSYSPFLT